MSRVSRKHQATLPVSVLKDAGLDEGDEVVIRAIGRWLHVALGKLPTDRYIPCIYN
jgi:bifunctional DNA-binding transcriptional regulator/antitoxin component of YhaV-PrlF toxin-antitoxin module